MKNILRKTDANTLPLAGIILLTILAPFDAVQRDIFAVSLSRIVFIFILYSFTLSFVLRSRKLHMPFVVIPMLLYVAAYLISLAHSFTTPAAYIAASVASYVVLFLLVINTVKTKGQVYLILLCFIISLSLVELLSVYKGATGASPLGLDIVTFEHRADFKKIARLEGTSDNPNVFATLLVFSLPVCLSFFVMYKRYLARLCLLFLLLAGVICLVMTQSRSAMLGLLISILFFCWHLFKKKADKRVLIYPPLMLAGAIFILCRVPTLAKLNPLARIADKRYYQSGGFNRIMLWKESLRYIGAHPLGSGIGKSGDSLYDFSGRLPIRQSIHNTFFATGVEEGWLGLLAVILLFGTMFSQLRRAINKANNLNDKLLLTGFMAALIGYFVHVQFHSFLGWNIVWIFFALIYILIRVTDSVSLSREQPMET